MPKSSPAEDFFSTTENNLDSTIKQTADFSYNFKESWLRELGWKYCLLFSIIQSLSTSKGYFYGSDRFLAQKCGVSISSIETGLKTLEEKGWIFRNSYPINKGAKRHIVTKFHISDYWNNVLSSTNMNKEVIIRFERFTKGQKIWSPEIKGPSWSLENDGPSWTPETKGSLLLRNNQGIKQENNSDEENVAVEFQKSGISGELLKIGLQYYQVNKERIDKKNNPMGFLIYAVKKGIAADELEKAKLQKDAVVAEETAWVENQNNAKKLYEELKEQQNGFSMHLNEHAIWFQFSDGGLPIGWRDPQFNKLIHVARRKAYDHIHHSRETNSLDESKTKGKQILRYSNEGKRKDAGGDQKLQN